MKKSIAVVLCIGLFSSIFADGRFGRDEGKGIVIDYKTNLMWQDDKVVELSWEGAIEYCESLTLGDYTDWHLPNYNELTSIVDRTRVIPSIDPIFQNIVSSDYWTSTLERTIDFYNGNSGPFSKEAFVRCVRNK